VKEPFAFQKFSHSYSTNHCRFDLKQTSGVYHTSVCALSGCRSVLVSDIGQKFSRFEGTGPGADTAIC